MIDNVLAEQTLDSSSKSFCLLGEVFVSIKNYVDNKLVDKTEPLSKKVVATQKLLSKNSEAVIETKVSVTALKKRFNRLVFTPLGSRVMLPYFGSRIHELIDKPMNFEWKILMKKYLFECFFDEKEQPWDKDFEPEKIRVIDLDIAKGSVEVQIEFKNGLEVSFGYGI